MIPKFTTKTVYISRSGFAVMAINVAKHGFNCDEKHVIYANLTETFDSMRGEIWTLPYNKFIEVFSPMTIRKDGELIRRVTLLVLGSPVMTFGMLDKCVANEDHIYDYIARAEHKGALVTGQSAHKIDTTISHDFILRDFLYKDYSCSLGNYGVLSADMVVQESAAEDMLRVLDDTAPVMADYFTGIQLELAGHSANGKVLIGKLHEAFLLTDLPPL